MKRKLSLTLSSWLLTLSYFLLATPAFAQPIPLYYEDVPSFKWLEVLFSNILIVALRLVGIAAFVMIVIGGFKILSSGGNPESMEAGKKTLGLAIGGLIFAILAWFILSLIKQITGVEVTQFNVILPN